MLQVTSEQEFVNDHFDAFMGQDLQLIDQHLINYFKMTTYTSVISVNLSH